MYSHDQNLRIALMIIDSMLELPDVGLEADPISGKMTSFNNNYAHMQYTLPVIAWCAVIQLITPRQFITMLAVSDSMLFAITSYHARTKA